MTDDCRRCGHPVINHGNGMCWIGMSMGEMCGCGRDEQSQRDERDRHYGSDTEALAWARDRVEAAVRRVDDMAAHLESKGEADKANGYRGAAWRIRSLLLGGEGCSVGAFDERMADYYAMRCVHGHQLDDRSHRC